MAKRVPVSPATKEYERIADAWPQIMPYIGKVNSMDDELAHELAVFTIPEELSGDPIGLMQALSGQDAEVLTSADVVWMGRWSRCRQVYRIDPEVAEQLRNQELEGDLPLEAIRRIPYPIIYIDCPCILRNENCEVASIGFLAMIDSSKGAEFLQICYLFKDRKRTTNLLPLMDGTLEDAAKAVVEENRKAFEIAAEKYGLPEEAYHQSEIDGPLSACAQAINMLLYIISAEDDAEIIYRPPSGQRGQKVGKKTNPETHHLMGARMGRAIGAAKTIAFTGKGDGTRTVAPVSTVAGFSVFVAVSPFRPGSV